MNRVTPKMRTIAECLISLEEAGDRSGAAHFAAVPVLEKLRPQLATLMGAAGYAALVARALVLAKADVKQLETLKVKADGTLEIVHASRPVVDTGSRDNREGSVALIVRLLELLTAFIGENLTLHLACEIWPNLLRMVSEMGNGVKNDESK